MINKIARILSIIYIIFISIFALDAGSFLGWLIHMIPSFVLIACLIIAWKKRFIGGLIFIILGIIFTIFFRTYNDVITLLIITVPLIVIGILFIIKKK